MNPMFWPVIIDVLATGRVESESRMYMDTVKLLMLSYCIWSGLSWFCGHFEHYGWDKVQRELGEATKWHASLTGRPVGVQGGQPCARRSQQFAGFHSNQDSTHRFTHLQVQRRDLSYLLRCSAGMKTSRLSAAPGLWSKVGRFTTKQLVGCNEK